MNSFIATILIVAILISISTQSSVSPQAACAKIGKYYAQGCSGLTAELLGKPWKKANAYHLGSSIGKNGQYSATPGEIVGFNGHVAVYIGKQACNCNFVDVPGPNKNVRCLNSYGSQTVYKASY